MLSPTYLCKQLIFHYSQLKSHHFRYHSYTLKQIAGVINFYKLLEISVDWTLEYLGHIQAIIANESVGNKKLQFLYDVYIVTIIILSGLDVFNDDFANTAQIRLRLFPQSVAQLIKNQLWQPHVLKVFSYDLNDFLIQLNIFRLPSGPFTLQTIREPLRITKWLSINRWSL